MTLTVDTAQVADGTHALALRVTDAAGNTQVADGGQVVTANGVAGAGGLDGLPYTGVPAGQPNGQNASRPVRLTARWLNGRRTRTLRYRRCASLRSRLLNERRQPIVGANVAILAADRRSGARSVRIGVARTDARGALRFLVPGGAARRITVAYAAFGGDRTVADSETLNARVRARVTASARPRSVRARRPVRIGGRLVYRPRAGVVVFLQGRDGRRWRTIDDARTRRRGRCACCYRFKRGSAGRSFALRVRVFRPNHAFSAEPRKPCACASAARVGGVMPADPTADALASAHPT